MRLNLKHLFILMALALSTSLIIFAYGGAPPEISNVKIGEVDKNTAIIEWNTNVETDAMINYGLNENYGITRYPLMGEKHQIKLEELDPSTTYYFQVVSSDISGNKSSSAGFSFTTGGILESISGIEKVGGAEERALVEKTFLALSQIASPEAIALIAKEVGKVVGELIRPPVIIGAPKVEEGTDFAEISWTTDRESSSLVYFATEDEYSAGGSDPYTLSQGDPNELVKKHQVRVIGLKPSTTYHFKVSSEDELGLMGESDDDIFTTKSILPEIKNINVIKVQETSATIVWNVDVPADGLVEYTNLRTNVTKSAGDPIFATSHSVRLEGLEFGTRYSVIIKSTNESGDEVVSDPFTFITVIDRVAPVISKVNSESTLFPGADTKIQTIVGWETDEPAFCQFFYSQGLSAGDEDQNQSMDREINPVAEHVQVVVGFLPSTVYRFWVVCEDSATNSTRSEDFVLFTPVKEKNIIDIIIENFEGTFGWVKNITN